MFWYEIVVYITLMVHVVAPISQTRCLVVSSLLFALPSAYAYHHGLYMHAGVLLSVVCASVNFWRRATRGFRRYVDIVVARVAFTVFVVNGVVLKNRSLPCVLSGYIALITAICLYRASGRQLLQGNANWYRYHFAFHMVLVYGIFVILYSMVCKVHEYKSHIV